MSEKTKVSIKDLAEIYNMEIIDEPKEETKKDGYTEFEKFTIKVDDDIEEQMQDAN